MAMGAGGCNSNSNTNYPPLLTFRSIFYFRANFSMKNSFFGHYLPEKYSCGVTLFQFMNFTYYDPGIILFFIKENERMIIIGLIAVFASNGSNFSVKNVNPNLEFFNPRSILLTFLNIIFLVIFHIFRTFFMITENWLYPKCVFHKVKEIMTIRDTCDLKVNYLPKEKPYPKMGCPINKK